MGLLDTVETALVVAERSGRIVLMNARMRKLLGLGVNAGAGINLFTELLKVDAKEISREIENGNHEVRLEVLRNACSEPRTAADCVPMLFNAGLPDHQYFFAIGESASHLVYLSEHGHVRIEGEFPWRFAR